MSKAAAHRLDGPFSSTSHHHDAGPPTVAMWLGTMSTTWLRPAAVRAWQSRS